MHRSAEQSKAELKNFVVAKAREVIANRDENQAKAAVAQAVWKALLDAPVWTIGMCEHPPSPWVEPEEIWSEHVNVTEKAEKP